MQNGSIIRSTRSNGPDVWDFRWREAGPDGRRKHRRIVIGPITQFPDRSSARLAIAELRCEINPNDPRLSLRPVTVSELVNHYRQRERATDHTWKTYSTKVTYQGYLNKWILPRWESYTLPAIKAGEVEQLGGGDLRAYFPRVRYRNLHRLRIGFLYLKENRMRTWIVVWAVRLRRETGCIVLRNRQFQIDRRDDLLRVI